LQEKKKLIDIKKIKFTDISREVRRLEYQKSVLEKAYDERYIQRKSYEEGRKEINKLIFRLKKRL